MVLTESINGHCGDKEFQEIDGIVEMGGGSSRNRADRPCTSENLLLKSKPLAKNVFAEIALKPLHEVV